MQEDPYEGSSRIHVQLSKRLGYVVRWSFEAPSLMAHHVRRGVHLLLCGTGISWKGLDYCFRSFVPKSVVF